MDKELIRRKACEMDGWLRDVRRDFHMHPELGLSEYRTSEKIKSYLEEMGIEYLTYEGSTCVVGLVRGAYPGRTVAIRADMDALPICESNEVSYKSEVNGIMHACGHDAHMTILLGTARFFAGIRDQLKGNIKLLFQPAEESVGGAYDMIESGCMKEPEVDYVTGLHVMPYLPCGVIETRYGALNGASDDIGIIIKGRKTHGAYPEGGIDAIAAAAQVISALQTIASRNVSPLDSMVLTIGMINGGTAGNIVADEVNMTATLRTASKEIRKLAKQRIIEIVSGVSSSLGAVGSVEINEGYEALINDSTVVDVIVESANEILGKGNVLMKEKPSLGVEDFSYFVNVCKGAFYHLGCGNAGKGITSPLHTDSFDIDEDCLHIGVMTHAAIALNLLNGQC
ncbi:MAG TPA: M20 family metallopeptidase [Ruminiclostridium sp.]|nr:M20 family metallopeptidase [Ruminiclostridium sp.]